MSGVVLVAVLGIVGLATALSLAALVEVFRQLAALRERLSLDDRPQLLDVDTAPLSATTLGLPDTVLLRERTAVIVLSNKCSTCRVIADAFDGSSPASVWFLVSEQGAEDSVIVDTLRALTTNVIVDDGAIAEQAGLDITPAVLVLVYGKATEGYVVATPRQMLHIIAAPALADRPRRLRPREPIAH